VHATSLYCQPAAATPADFEFMRILDEQYLKTPFYGTRRMTTKLRLHGGYTISRKRVRRLMRLMGLEAI
jgi:putative transposase